MYLGAVKLSEEKFHRNFDGCYAVFLHHMFESRHGEVIAIHSDEAAACGAAATACGVADDSVENPEHILYRCTQRRTQRRLLCQPLLDAVSFHRTPKKKLRKHAIEQFLWSQSAVPNSVYKPMDDQGRRCRTSTVKYYSLASLVWECCDIANLLDLYTFFCSSRLLVAKAPHSSTGSKSREKHGTGCGIPRAEKNMAWHRLGVFSVRLETKTHRLSHTHGLMAKVRGKGKHMQAWVVIGLCAIRLRHWIMASL
jgi:hypothetical protein